MQTTAIGTSDRSLTSPVSLLKHVAPFPRGTRIHRSNSNMIYTLQTRYSLVTQVTAVACCFQTILISG